MPDGTLATSRAPSDSGARPPAHGQVAPFRNVADPTRFGPDSFDRTVPGRRYRPAVNIIRP